MPSPFVLGLQTSAAFKKKPGSGLWVRPFGLSLLSELCLGGRSLFWALGGLLAVNAHLCDDLRDPRLRPGTRRAPGPEAPPTVDCFRRLGPWRRREPPLRRVTQRPGSAGEADRRGAAHQAVQREGGPGLNHVDPTDGNEEARRPARRLGVQRQVTQEGVGPPGPRGGRRGRGLTLLGRRLRRQKT